MKMSLKVMASYLYVPLHSCFNLKLLDVTFVIWCAIQMHVTIFIDIQIINHNVKSQQSGDFQGSINLCLVVNGI